MTELPEKPTYRVSEIAWYFDVSERTVYLWIENKHLETVLTPSGQWRITKQSLDACRFAPKNKKIDDLN